ncbi:hypothetical protein, partial [Klebsiella pneumoniae]|uniref:hypothetical protein n=1 Tax=Klebsiella pneumoniae TaxID=573 RepID=UPI003969AE85
GLKTVFMGPEGVGSCALWLALFSIKTALAALKEDKPTAKETPYEPMPENLDAIETQAKGAH